MGDALFIGTDGNDFCRFDNLALAGMAIKGAGTNLNIFMVRLKHFTTHSVS